MLGFFNFDIDTHFYHSIDVLFEEPYWYVQLILSRVEKPHFGSMWGKVVWLAIYFYTTIQNK